MPDIDPSSLQSSEPVQSLNPSTLTLSKANASANSAAAAQKASKAEKDKGQQRTDIEPIYASLKANIGDQWQLYKEAVGQFVLGQLNQSELCLRINHLICYSADTEHLHNSLITALFANCHRDPPEPGVAPWVAANDKPASGVGGSGASKGGDKVEERLRRQVMALPGRDRRRLKEVGEREPHDPNAMYPISAMNDYRLARSIKLPDSVPASAGGLSKTNWDLEIRKRYTQQLSHETLEFPDPASIQHRMLPICYEEALPNGPADQCAEFVSIATEMYIKEIVSNVLSHTRPFFAKYGRMNDDGPLSSVGGRPISLADMRVALSISSCNMGSMPDVITEIMGGWREGVLEGWDDYNQELDLDPGRGFIIGTGTNSHAVPMSRNFTATTLNKSFDGAPNGTLVNGMTNGSAVNGVTELLANGSHQAYIKGFDEPAAEGWAGSSTMERDHLFDVLDECLNLGQ